MLTRAYQALRTRFYPSESGLFGDYTSWVEAQKASSGYDAEIILEKTKAACLRVKRGEAVHERDSVLFDKVEYSWPLLAGLMWGAAQSGGTLNVLDFGGSLGSTYFQNRAFLDQVENVRWNIVEQPHYVAVGRRDFQDERLRFFESIEECVSETQPNIVIVSGVLQYLERPYEILKKLVAVNTNNIILDRTPFWDGAEDRLCVQRVPPRIYCASYPSWIFSRAHFIAELSGSGFAVVADFSNNDREKGPVTVTYRGIILSR